MPNLTTLQLRAAEKWLAEIGTATRQRGELLHADGAVIEIEAYVRGLGWKAVVLGESSTYRTKLRWDDGWSAECTCPMVEDCKHGVAVMIAALPRQHTQIKAAPDARQAAKAPAPTPVVEGHQTFVEEVEERLGRALNVEEMRASRLLDELRHAYGHADQVPQHAVDRIVRPRHSGTPNWEPVLIWPEPPNTPWTTWLYVAAYLRRNDLPIPEGLLAITNWTEVDALVGDWHRETEVERWQDWLQQVAQLETTTSGKHHELRVRFALEEVQLEWRKESQGEFKPVAQAAFQQLVSEGFGGAVPFDEVSNLIWQAFNTGYGSQPIRQYEEPDCLRILNNLLRRPETAPRLIGPDGDVLVPSPLPLTWRANVTEASRADYHLSLVLPDGSSPLPALVLVEGQPSYYVTATTIHTAPPLGGLKQVSTLTIPAEALETADGVAFLDRLQITPPERMASRIRTSKSRPVFRCHVETNKWDSTERLVVEIFAENAPGELHEVYHRDGWRPVLDHAVKLDVGSIVRHDRSALAPVPELLASLKLQWWQPESHWHKTVGRKFPELFAEWLASLPENATLILDAILGSLRDAPVRATVKLEVEENGIDWFDLKVALDVRDTTLTKAEIKALLDARGGFVRLGNKGWRRLQFDLSPEDETQLAELGLNAGELNAEPQRLHALQLAGKTAAKRLLSENHSNVIERRAEEIRTRVSPELPGGILAELRPYQIEGFHFLAYLSSNHFGGILADDMGLGKTLQTLSWLLWLTNESKAIGAPHLPSLVVCPKSVMDNWRSETARFAPEIRLQVLCRGAEAADLRKAREQSDLIVLNYAQLRILEEVITSVPWRAVILDEAQAIKNPDSATARAAWNLKADHRLALSGTPIENRLLDLWSIMQFVMPGVLGKRAAFGKNFDQRSDPFARRRLAARVRPFVLRRTKGEVAKDLPERIEEDLLCELDGEQATLYRAEMKRARSALLKIQTKAQLDESRFNILASLMRLRQICCHPALVGGKAAKAVKAAKGKGKAKVEEPDPITDTPDSAKLTALMDLLEPLIEEGHKVLVFSQFVQMLELIEKEIDARGWRQFLLTGETEDRGPLVESFQTLEGPAVFLISLRAGGFGLNLTAASYVVLYDPWWNPAVENQAIDRTHRIGQRHTVIAYRLLIKDTIEEKIRSLQKQKSALATDILGEESFARTLTLEDFNFLLSDG